MMKRIFLLTFFMFFAAFLFADVDENISAEAEQLMRNGDYYKAVIEYTKLLKEEQDSDLFLARGDAKFLLGNYNGAIGDYTSALEIEASSRTYVSRGKAELLFEQYDDAIKDFNAALTMENSAYVHALLACVNFKRGNYIEAIRNTTNAIKVLPDAFFYSRRGIAYQSIKQYYNALHDFTTAIDMENDNLEYYTFRHELYKVMQKFDLVDEDSAAIDAINEDYDSAIKKLTEVLRKKQNHNIYYKLGLLKSKSGDNFGAINDFTSSIELKKTPEAFLERGKVNSKIKKYNAAVEDFNTSLKMKKTPEAYFEIAEIYFSSKKYEQAIEFYNKALKMEQNLEAIINRWNCFYELGNYKNIILEKMSVVSRFNDIRLWDLSAKAEFKIGMYNEALKDTEKSLKIAPKTETYVLIAEIYEKMKEYRKAILNYTIAIDIEKDNVGFIAKQNLKNFYSKRSELYTLINRKDLAQADKGYFSAIVGSYQNNVAIAEFTKSLEMKQNAEVYIARGELKLKNQDYKEALADFNRALKIKQSATAYLYIGNTQMEMNKYDEALKSFNKSLQIDANKDETYHALAKLMEKKGEYDKAITYCTKALSIRERRIYYILRSSLYEKILKSDLAMADKGNIKVMFGNYKDAIKDYAKSLEIYENAFVYAKKGEMEEKLDMYEQALNDYTKAIELDKTGKYTQLKEDLLLKIPEKQKVIIKLKELEDILFTE